MLTLVCRDIIRNSVNASEMDAVIFVSSGVTGAIHKLIHGMNMHKPPVSLPCSPINHSCALQRLINNTYTQPRPI